ncbi:alpha,alpha-trehalose phosphorylase (configuration-retaining) [Nematocida homosporus]|uniref:alpha,alpha-trehalose phosphorylase (configuration-retaining) n=1 Tax=Nematocida homosporus TaxID=1912981 RepID=UPI00221FEBA7|nr:alpha,alpha-trehalose phosphorylase (configuration-retaining) [Nematocida homosporus]KAI5184895.1 alpha,alpha-trehalose phosphorylase (configuration-retaining) [Nematocida homosporus]
MVNRPIFLGISTGVSPEKNSLELSITINDGFFVLGTKNYTFPIVSADEESGSPSPGVSPQMTLNDDDGALGDCDFEEIKGMYIDLKKRVVVQQAQNLALAQNNKTINLGTKAKLDCQAGVGPCGTDACRADYKFFSKLPKAIFEETLKDEPVNSPEIITFDYFSIEVLETFSNVLLVVLDKWIGEYSRGNAIKIVGAGISTQTLLLANFSEQFKFMLWTKYDIHPVFFSGGTRPLDQQSESLARKCASLFGQENLPRLSIVENNRVNIDVGNIWFCSLNDYIPLLGPKGAEFMSQLISNANAIANERISFFSSTAQGGGVALMRHALLRVFSMLGVNASWYVCVPSPIVFRITKKKIHNILQGVASPELTLDSNDKAKVDKWLKNNYESNWKQVIKNSTFIVLDDQQVARLVPLIRKDNPTIKIAYRSHIQIRGECIKDNPQLTNTWNFLWDALKDVDYFIAHPIETSVPLDVPQEKVLFQPAGTDPLDSLNKPLSHATDVYYQNVFNRICIDNGESPVNFNHPYIVQVARFDPSKGIPDLLDAYYKLYQLYNQQKPKETFNIGLVICGHGSVDDPEGSQIFKQVSDIIESEQFHVLKLLITKIRLPPSDQLLNVILRNATVCCQLSLCEGYEVKVTEALLKQVPVIAYNVGGLPHQIRNGVNGYIVDKHNSDQVAQHLYNLLYNKEEHQKIRNGINAKDFSYITTPFQAFFWIHLIQLAKTNQTSKTQYIYQELIKKYLE